MLATFLEQHSAQIRDLEVKEIFDNVTLRFTMPSSLNANILQLFDELKTLSSRDTYELTLDIDGSDLKISECSAENLSSLNALLEESDLLNEDRTINLKIWKYLQEGKLSVYFFNEFVTFLTNQNMLNFLESISKRFDTFLTFEVFETIDEFGSETIKFVDTTSSVETKLSSSNQREKTLSLFLENANIQGISLKLLPDDFKFINKSKDELLNLLFDKVCVALSLIYIANVSELTSRGELNYKLSGYKTISRQNEDLDHFVSEIEFLFKIYSWLYSDGNSSDKIGLARNVITLHTDESGRFKFDLEVWNAIQSNYQIYLKGNIQGYLEVKNKIGELVIDSSTKLYFVADEMTNAFKNNLLIILTFIVTVVLVNGLKDNGVDQIFSNTYLWVVFIISVLSILWLIMAYIEANKRFDSMSANLKNILILNYNNILMRSEIDDSIDPVINDSHVYFKKQVNRNGIWWFIITVVFFTFFFGATHFYLCKAEIDNVRTNESAIPDVKEETPIDTFYNLLFDTDTKNVKKIPFK